jgi:hypothetical protein
MGHMCLAPRQAGLLAWLCDRQTVSSVVTVTTLSQPHAPRAFPHKHDVDPLGVNVRPGTKATAPALFGTLLRGCL